MAVLLLVDDEELTRDGIHDGIQWKDLGIDTVLTARNGLDALHVLGGLTPDILLTDVRMPKMDGIELSKRIRERFPECAIIFLSGYSDEAYLRTAIDVKAEKYVDKPINLDYLCLLIKRVMEQYEARMRERRRIERSNLLIPEPDSYSYENRLVDGTLRIINRELSNPDLSITMICDELDVTAPYICALFKSEVGATIVRYITSKRIDLAAQLLKSSRLKINEIADRCGYSSTNYFIRVFKKNIGILPTRYRSENQT